MIKTAYAALMRRLRPLRALLAAKDFVAGDLKLNDRRFGRSIGGEHVAAAAQDQKLGAQIPNRLKESAKCPLAARTASAEIPEDQHTKRRFGLGHAPDCLRAHACIQVHGGS